MPFAAQWLYDPAQITREQTEGLGVNVEICRAVADNMGRDDLGDRVTAEEVLVLEPIALGARRNFPPGIPLILRVEVAPSRWRLANLSKASDAIGEELAQHIPGRQDFCVWVVVSSMAWSIHIGL